MELTCKDCIFNKYCGKETKIEKCTDRKTKEDLEAEIKAYDESKRRKKVVKVWQRRK